MWFHKKDEMDKEGLKQASFVFGYVVVFTMLVVNGGRLFPHINTVFAPLMFLTLFCFSVLACGLIVFYKPYLLFVDKKGKEGMKLILATTKWLGVFAISTVLAVAILSR